MKTNEKRDKIVAAVSTGFFMIAVIGMVILHDSNKSLEELLSGERLNNENLLSEKLAVGKELHLSAEKLSGLQKRNREIMAALEDANDKIAHREAELARMRKNANNATKTKELEELRRQRQSLQAELAQLQENLKRYMSENEGLALQLNEMSRSRESLQQNYDLLKAFAANNYRLEASRGKNDRLTVVAKRTKKLSLDFEVPADLANAIKFRIKKPNGQTIDESNEGLTTLIAPEDEAQGLMVSLVDVNSNAQVQKVKMQYVPKEKLQKGIYTIEIYKDSEYMMSCQLKLR